MTLCIGKRTSDTSPRRGRARKEKEVRKFAYVVHKRGKCDGVDVERLELVNETNVFREYQNEIFKHDVASKKKT